MNGKRTALTVGVIGLGRMGRNHVRVLSLLKGADIQFVFDTNDDNMTDVATAFGLTPAKDLASALATVDAVIIASPTSTHADYIAMASEKVRNIFVEKPIAQNVEMAETVGRLVRERDLNLQVGFIERFNPAVRQLAQVLRSSSEVVSLDFTRTNKISERITDVDVVADLMIHDLDLALHLNGPIREVSANGVSRNGVIEFATALLTHANGRFSRVMASRITEKKLRHIQATCRDMFVDCDLLRKEIVISRQTEVSQPAGGPYTITAMEETLEVPPHEALMLELQAFLESCSGGSTQAGPGAQSGIDSMRICDAIQRDILNQA